MEQKALRLGHFLALAGALAAVGSLWRPWYSVRLPAEVRELFGADGQLGSDPGLFGQLARGIGAAIPGSVSVSGWEVLEGADVVIAVVAAGVAVAVLAASGAIAGLRVDAGLAARVACAAGALVLVLAAWHLVDRPGGDQAAQWLHAEQGLWIALAAGAAMLGGGVWASAQVTVGTTTATGPATSATPSLNAAFPPLTPELPPVFAETAGGAAGSSVPPPRP
jgi:hypothetical protein